eukprot:3566602-Amphidinium_carterae.3
MAPIWVDPPLYIIHVGKFTPVIMKSKHLCCNGISTTPTISPHGATHMCCVQRVRQKQTSSDDDKNNTNNVNVSRTT